MAQSQHLPIYLESIVPTIEALTEQSYQDGLLLKCSRAEIWDKWREGFITTVFSKHFDLD